MPELIRQGVKLAYQEAGSGGPPLLFVHGFGGSVEHFTPQMEFFKRSHRVVALDRRGHGRSDKPAGPYSISEIAEEVAWTARELGLHRPMLVVHSMGAIGFELVSQNPDLLSALAVLDAPINPPGWARQAFERLLGGLRTPAYRQVIDELCDRLIFLPTDEPARRARLHAALLETPREVLLATWEGFVAYDPAPVLARCKLPLLYVGGVMPCDEAKLKELCPQVMIGRTVGAGHMHQLEVPDQINAMLARFIDLATRAASA